MHLNCLLLHHAYAALALIPEEAALTLRSEQTTPAVSRSYQHHEHA